MSTSVGAINVGRFKPMNERKNRLSRLFMSCLFLLCFSVGAHANAEIIKLVGDGSGQSLFFDYDRIREKVMFQGAPVIKLDLPYPNEAKSIVGNTTLENQKKIEVRVLELVAYLRLHHKANTVYVLRYPVASSELYKMNDLNCIDITNELIAALNNLLTAKFADLDISKFTNWDIRFFGVNKTDWPEINSHEGDE
jgi:hypothetical protein